MDMATYWSLRFSKTPLSTKTHTNESVVAFISIWPVLSSTNYHST